LILGGDAPIAEYSLISGGVDLGALGMPIIQFGVRSTINAERSWRTRLRGSRSPTAGFAEPTWRDTVSVSCRDLRAVVPTCDAAAMLSVDMLRPLLQAAWGPDTSYPDASEDWRPDNPARAQCGMTALVVQDLLGGDLILGEVHVDGVKVENHYWNRLPDGSEVDLTADQSLPGRRSSRGRRARPGLSPHGRRAPGRIGRHGRRHRVT
jgi:hypothetical protein